MTLAKVYRSNVVDIHMHETGMIWLPSEVHITRLPLYDGSYMARLGHGPASRWLRSKGMRLPTVQEYLELKTLSLVLKPVTLPTVAMLGLAGVPKPWADRQGKDTPHMRRYRAAHIMSENWCSIHDVACWTQMANLKWDGEQPVYCFGKYWGTGHRGPNTPCIFGWNGIQPESYFHLGDPTYVDYATTFHGVLL